MPVPQLGIFQLSLGDAVGFLWLWPSVACAERGADGPVGRPGVGRVHAAVLFSLSFRRLPVANVILSLEALPLGSAGRPPPASSRLCYTRPPWPAAPVAGFTADLRAGEPLQTGGGVRGCLRHDREFRPPRYLRIGQLMVSAEHFSIGEANTI